MHADLDLLCISVYCTADDLLPERPSNARRRLSDAEIVTLCVAQVLMGIPSDRRFLRAARRQLGHLFPLLPSQDALHKRRSRLAESIEWLIGVFAAQSPGSSDDLVLLDSKPVECGRSVETTRRSQLADVCGYGYSSSHSRGFGGCGCISPAHPTGHPELQRSSLPTGPNARSRSRCCRGHSGVARRSSAIKATPDASSPRPWPHSARPCSDRPAATNHNTGPSAVPRFADRGRSRSSRGNRSDRRRGTCRATRSEIAARPTRSAASREGT